MPNQLKRIRILLSSSGDLKEERNVLVDVVEDLQRKVGNEKGLFFELVRWEKTSLPAMGRSQEVINQQISPTDVFIGIIWSRFGTPVGGAGSGTEEEFVRAFDSWQILGRPHIMLYFCDRPLSISDVEPVNNTGSGHSN